MSRRLIKNTATIDKRISEAVKGVAIKEGPSTIKDSDVAEASSDYIKYQILQQSTATLLSTANQMPSIALNLI